jgi:integrase/recombinase XerD
MVSHNAQNERIKRQYFAYLKEAKRFSEASLDAVAAALHRFEAYNRFKDFKAFHHQQAIAFKRHLAEQKNERSGQPLSKATLHATLTALKNFFHWLAGQPGYRSRFSYADSEYFNISEKEARVAKAHRDRDGPTIEQVRHVLASMANGTDIEKRDRALIAFALLTGARDNAIASFRLKHIDIGAGRVEQDAREVRTKFSKSFPTWFFPVGDDVREILVEWVRFLKEERLWGMDDALFPATKTAQNADRQFYAEGLARHCWSNAGPIRTIFRRAFEQAGLPYFHPHSFRKTLTQLGQAKCRTPEEFKAWSQNLGHEKVMTTFSSYGVVAPARQADIIASLASHSPVSNEQANLKHLAELLSKAVNGMGG